MSTTANASLIIAVGLFPQSFDGVLYLGTHVTVDGQEDGYRILSHKDCLLHRQANFRLQSRFKAG